MTFQEKENRYNADRIAIYLDKMFERMADELLAEATNIYHNTENDKSIEEIVSDLKRQYLEKVLSGDMTYWEVESKIDGVSRK
tara:strand:+ start:686 stop:934 length:249 start_codon:yes stop_codon:yes gene_type:complete